MELISSYKEENKMIDNRKKINKCRFSIPDLDMVQKKAKYLCVQKDTPIAEEVCEQCKEYRSRYIEYPIQVNEIQNNFSIREGLHKNYIGKLVKVRPCDDKYEGKTYLGIFLGDLPVGVIVSFQEGAGVLGLSAETNPAIFVPELKQIIYGCESWWGIIDDLNELKDITEEEIESVWYVRLLKEMCGEEKNGTGNQG